MVRESQVPIQVVDHSVLLFCNSASLAVDEYLNILCNAIYYFRNISSCNDKTTMDVKTISRFSSFLAKFLDIILEAIKVQFHLIMVA